jgi:hypothetical protein
MNWMMLLSVQHVGGRMHPTTRSQLEVMEGELARKFLITEHSKQPHQVLPPRIHLPNSPRTPSLRSQQSYSMTVQFLSIAEHHV